MNRERLLDLIEVLKEPPLPGERFTMVYFGRVEDCGTACCAAGKYALHRPNAGLCLLTSKDGIGDIRDEAGNRDYWALASHFGITTKEAGWLFTPSSYDGAPPITQAHVIARVEKLLASVDWLSVSPHDPIKMVQMYGNELKIVPGLNGLGISDFLRVIPIQRFLYLYVQPLWDVKNNEEDKASLRECLDFIKLKENANWSLSRQDHKYWSFA